MVNCIFELRRYASVVLRSNDDKCIEFLNDSTEVSIALGWIWVSHGAIRVRSPLQGLGNDVIGDWTKRKWISEEVESVDCGALSGRVGGNDI